MTFAFYTNMISPHQLPLARKLAGQFGEGNYRYIYTDSLTAERKRLGWTESDEPWIVPSESHVAQTWLRDADIVMMQHPRDWDLFEDRLRRGRMCLYASERWFKPISLAGIFKWGASGFYVDGCMRMMVRSYRKMARRFLDLTSRYPNFHILPVGIHSRKDFIRMGVPEERMVDWGYFVEPSAGTPRQCMAGDAANPTALRVLWVGRMIGWKRVDTLIRACARASMYRDVKLTLVGGGPERERLRRLAERLAMEGKIEFVPNVPIGEVRRLMRKNDVYVLSSDGQEGWGAALSEALSEGMSCLGTFEAGASATILPPDRLYRAGDWRKLAKLLIEVESLSSTDFLRWTVTAAAERLTGMVT